MNLLERIAIEAVARDSHEADAADAVYLNIAADVPEQTGICDQVSTSLTSVHPCHKL